MLSPRTAPVIQVVSRIIHGFHEGQARFRLLAHQLHVQPVRVVVANVDLKTAQVRLNRASQSPRDGEREKVRGGKIGIESNIDLKSPGFHRIQWSKNVIHHPIIRDHFTEREMVKIPTRIPNRPVVDAPVGAHLPVLNDAHGKQPRVLPDVRRA